MLDVTDKTATHAPPKDFQEHLAALEQICLIPCDEYDDLKRAITEYNKLANR